MALGDNFFDAVDLGSAHYGNTVVDNTGATFEAGEDDTGLGWSWYFPSGAHDGGSVWYTWVAPADGELVVRTGLTPLPSWDTYLEVYDGDGTKTGLELLAGDDDSDIQAGSADPFGTSMVSAIPVVPGQRYWFRLTFFNDVSGPMERLDGRLDWGLIVPGIPAPTMVTVRGRYLNQDDMTPASGSLTFTLENLIRITGVIAPYVIVPFSTEVALDGSGYFSIDLPAVYDTLTNPGGSRYGVEEVIDGRRRGYTLTLTPDVVDVDMADPSEP